MTQEEVGTMEDFETIKDIETYGDHEIFEDSATIQNLSPWQQWDSLDHKYSLNSFDH